jgi:hypothetical protein
MGETRLPTTGANIVYKSVSGIAEIRSKAIKAQRQ